MKTAGCEEYLQLHQPHQLPPDRQQPEQIDKVLGDSFNNGVPPDLLPARVVEKGRMRGIFASTSIHTTQSGDEVRVRGRQTQVSGGGHLKVLADDRCPTGGDLVT